MRLIFSTNSSDLVALVERRLRPCTAQSRKIDDNINQEEAKRKDKQKTTKRMKTRTRTKTRGMTTTLPLCGTIAVCLSLLISLSLALEGASQVRQTEKQKEGEDGD